MNLDIHAVLKQFIKLFLKLKTLFGFIQGDSINLKKERNSLFQNQS